MKMHLQWTLGSFFFPLFLFLLSHSLSFGQSITEGLGGVKTHFNIYTDSLELECIDQQLIRRGISEIKEEVMLEYAGGYGHEVIHFELILNQELPSIKRKKAFGKDKRFYELRFKDKDGELLYFYRVGEEQVKLFQSKGSPFSTYSFNFKEIPMVILENTASLILLRIRESKK